MAQSGNGIRRHVVNLAAGLACLWTGYFLCHKWQTFDAVELSALAAVLIACYVVAARAVAAGRLPFVARLPYQALGVRLLFAGALAAAATFAGLLTSRPVAALDALCAVVVGGYVGFAAVFRAPRPAARNLFALVFAGMVVIVLLAGAAGWNRAFGLVSAALALYLVVRLGLYARRALADCTAERLDSFADNALMATGLFSGALLAARISPGPSAKAELAWPLIAAVFSVVVIRIWPFLPRGDAGGAGDAG